MDIEFKAKVFVSLAFYVNYIDSIITQAWVVFFGVVCGCCFFFLVHSALVSAKVDILFKGKLIQKLWYVCTSINDISGGKVLTKYTQRQNIYLHPSDTMNFPCKTAAVSKWLKRLWHPSLAPHPHFIALEGMAERERKYKAQLTCKLLQYLFARVLRNTNMFCIVYKLAKSLFDVVYSFTTTTITISHGNECVVYVKLVRLHHAMA